MVANGDLAQRRCEGSETRLDQVVQKVYNSHSKHLTGMLHDAMPGKALATETVRSRELPQWVARVAWQGAVQLWLCLEEAGGVARHPYDRALRPASITYIRMSHRGVVDNCWRETQVDVHPAASSSSEGRRNWVWVDSGGLHNVVASAGASAG